MSVTLGVSEKHGYAREFLCENPDRLHHTYVIGQTGTGKTTLLRNSLLQDIEAGEGVALIDPHGDLAEAIVDMVPSHRTNDVIYFNPADTEYPIGLNPLSRTAPEWHHLVILNTTSALRGLWSEVWGTGRMQYILTNTLAALLHYDHATLLGVNRLLSDEQFRTKVLARVHDPIVRAFWEDEFARYPARLQAEAISPIQNKVGQFGTTTMTRNILGQARNAIDFRRVMDERQIFIANLSKGVMGEDNSRLIGSLLVAQFQLAALSRANLYEEGRVPFYLYIDEFQNFTNVESLSSILSEARKYRLSLTLAHQYTAQIGDELRSAVFGNVGTIVCFRVGFEDAEKLAEQLEPLAPHSLTELDPHCAWARQLKGGTMLEPEFVQLHPPIVVRHSRIHTIIKETRRKYGTPRRVVENKIETWLTH